MPASSIDFFNMQEAKNNFNTMRPAPICNENSSNQLLGHCQNVHVSRNCYYGYHDTKILGNVNENTDCEMKEISQPTQTEASSQTPRKRCADYCAYPQSKRLREGENCHRQCYKGSLIKYFKDCDGVWIKASKYSQCKMILPCAAVLAHGQARATLLPPLM